METTKKAPSPVYTFFLKAMKRAADKGKPLPDYKTIAEKAKAKGLKPYPIIYGRVMRALDSTKDAPKVKRAVEVKKPQPKKPRASKAAPAVKSPSRKAGKYGTLSKLLERRVTMLADLEKLDAQIAKAAEKIAQ